MGVEKRFFFLFCFSEFFVLEKERHAYILRNVFISFFLLAFFLVRKSA